MRSDGTVYGVLGVADGLSESSTARLCESSAPVQQQLPLSLGANLRGGEKSLYSFSDYMLALLIIIVLVTLLFGILGSVIISRSMANPIRIFASRVAEAQKSQAGIPDLWPTGIREIGQFIGTIVSLSRSVTESSIRMLRIH